MSIFRTGSKSDKAFKALSRSGNHGLTSKQIAKVSGLNEVSVINTFNKKVREYYGSKSIVKKNGIFYLHINSSDDVQEKKTFRTESTTRQSSKPNGSLNGIELIIGSENTHLIKRIPKEVLPSIKVLCQEAIRGLEAQQGLISLVNLYK
jgi:hypothetical protein